MLKNCFNSIFVWEWTGLCRVYLEHYTSILTCGKEELEILYGRKEIFQFIFLEKFFLQYLELWSKSFLRLLITSWRTIFWNGKILIIIFKFNDDFDSKYSFFSREVILADRDMVEQVKFFTDKRKVWIE